MTNALLVYPRNPKTFWSYDAALEIAGKKSMFPPTGLLTIASYLPENYKVRLIDENVNKLMDSDLEWADVVLTSSMGIHKQSLENIIERSNAHQKPVMAGGPLPTQYHDKIKGNAIFFLGEAENGFVEELDAIIKKDYVAERAVIDKRGRFKSLNHTPLQRFELLEKTLKDYQVMAVQITRGCPEHCTFCNIGSLYGYKTRIKEKGRLIAELDELYRIGWRGSIMIVDDNVAGNQDALIPILKEISEWQKLHEYCFSFFTQASLRIYDNKELMEVIYQAGFDQIFFGLESPSIESLRSAGAQKNIKEKSKTGMSMAEKVKYIGENYFKPQSGFIIGFDKDPDNIDEMMINFIRETRISVAMVGPLGILPDTADYTRFSREGRLIKDIIYSGDTGVFTRQLSYIPHNSKGQEIGSDVVTNKVKKVLESIYSPKEYFSRTLDFIINRKRKPLSMMKINPFKIWVALKSFYTQGIKSSYRNIYWDYLWKVSRHDLKDIPDAISYGVEGHHLITMTKETLKVDDVNRDIEKILAAEEPKHHEYLERFKREFKELIKKHRRIKKDFKPDVNGLDKLKDRYSKLFK